MLFPKVLLRRAALGCSLAAGAANNQTLSQRPNTEKEKKKKNKYPAAVPRAEPTRDMRKFVWVRDIIVFSLPRQSTTMTSQFQADGKQGPGPCLLLYYVYEIELE